MKYGALGDRDVSRVNDDGKWVILWRRDKWKEPHYARLARRLIRRAAWPRAALKCCASCGNRPLLR